MTKDEITLALKEVIALNSRYTIDEIKTTDRLDKFITSFMKGKFIRRIAHRFELIQPTKLTNAAYDSLKKVSQLIDFIDNIYNPVP